MNTHFTQHAVAFTLAALMTVGVLGSLDAVAMSRYQSAQLTAAQTTAAQVAVAQQALCSTKA